MLSKSAVPEDVVHALPADVPPEDVDFDSLCARDAHCLVRFLKERTGHGHVMSVVSNRAPLVGMHFIYISRSDEDRASLEDTFEYMQRYALSSTAEEHGSAILSIMSERAAYIDQNGGFEMLHPHTITMAIGTTEENIQGLVLRLSQMAPDVVIFGLRGIAAKGYQLSFSTTMPNKGILEYLQPRFPGRGLVLQSLGMSAEDRAHKESVERMIDERERLRRLDTAETVEETEKLIRDIRADYPDLDVLVHDAVSASTDEALAADIVKGLREISLEGSAT